MTSTSLARRLALWGPVALQMAVIFGASSLPNLDLGAVPGSPPDWIGHGVGYGLLAGLILRALAGGRLSGVTAGRAAVSATAAAVYGLSDEFHQSFVPGRFAGAADLAFDAAGALLGGLAGWVWARARRSSRSARV